jgi:hypothetical protein
MVSHPNSQGWVFTTSAMTEVQPELSRSSQKANKFLVFTVSSLKPNFTQFKLPKILKEMIKHVKVNDVDGFVVCIILIYSHNGQPIYIGQVTLIRV